MVLADVTVCHAAAQRYRGGAAREAGRAAKRREQEKTNLYKTEGPNGYAFVPLVTETFGRHGGGAMNLLNRLGDAAAEAGVHRRTFMQGALRELSVSLVCGNGEMFRTGRNVLLRCCGRDFQPGRVRPSADYE